jgi:hypothetical protein
MKLATSRDLFAYWDGLRGRRIAPERGDLAPSAIARALGRALGDVFMLDLEPGFGHPFRLAGTRLCAAFGRELRGSGFFLLWADVAPIRELMDTLEHEVSGAVAHVTGKNVEGQTLAFEMLLLPLGHRGRMPGRMLGSLAPLEYPYWLGARPLAALRLESLRFLGPRVDLVPAPRFAAAPPVAAPPATRPFLVVHQGGRQS